LNSLEPDLPEQRPEAGVFPKEVGERMGREEDGVRMACGHDHLEKRDRLVQPAQLNQGNRLREQR
jgi:hypothetical protein